MPLPRLIAIMGSGETSPTMTKVHRALLARLGPSCSAVFLTTPVGFQLNAHEIAAKAARYFTESVGHELQLATWRGTGDDPVAYERTLALLRAASYVFAGPGSPTYALRQWRGSEIEEELRAKVRTGGCLTFASAAALTLGRFTVPVYEIYKVGEEVRWERGLDLLGDVGLNVAVIPHFDNAEGGTHDTRYCYLGEPRLAALEEQLPEDVFVLGVDEHTALVLDLDAGSATVAGRGVVTIRRRNEQRHLAAGETAPLAELGAAAAAAPAPRVVLEDSDSDQPTFWSEVEACRDAFAAALDAGDADGAARASLTLEEHLAKWSTEVFASDEHSRARGVLREMLVRLAEAAGRGLRSERERLAPLVESLLELRAGARAEGRFELADALRAALVEGGIEVRDHPNGSDWELRAP